jgi:hypothetical protein
MVDDPVDEGSPAPLLHCFLERMKRMLRMGKAPF